MTTLHLCRGLPASGKTRFAREPFEDGVDECLRSFDPPVENDRSER